MIPRQDFSGYNATAGLVSDASRTRSDSQIALANLRANIIKERLDRAQRQQEAAQQLAQFAAQLNQNRQLEGSKLGEGARQFDISSGLEGSKLGENARQFDISSGLEGSKLGENARQFDISQINDATNKLQYQNFLSGENSLDREFKSDTLLQELLGKQTDREVSRSLEQQKLAESARQANLQAETLRRGQDRELDEREVSNRGRQFARNEEIISQITDPNFRPETTRYLDADGQQLAINVFLQKQLVGLRKELADIVSDKGKVTLNDFTSLLGKYFNKNDIEVLPDSAKEQVEQVLLGLTRGALAQDLSINPIYNIYSQFLPFPANLRSGKKNFPGNQYYSDPNQFFSAIDSQLTGLGRLLQSNNL